MEDNGCLSRLEVRLYELLNKMLGQERWDDARKLVKIMQSLGIV